MTTVRTFCRVTPEGGKAVEAPAAAKAWGLIMGADDPGRLPALNGPRMFLLDKPAVVAAIQQLPGADRCERYTAWLGTPPPHQPLVGSSP